MYKRILIVNRADCAARLIRACHEEGAEAFVVAAKKDLPAPCEADGIVYTGMSREAWSAQDDIFEVARHFGCEAILPGWGFLSEDFSFARRCRFLGLHFIGPKTKHLQAFGDKLKTLQILGNTLDSPPVAVSCREPDALDRIQKAMVPPFMLKDRFGGGGKNISFVSSLEELSKQLAFLTKHHLESQFFVEPARLHCRHIELQYLGDGHGRVDCLGARDCSMQVRHQKWLEISIDPCSIPGLKRILSLMAEKLAEMKYLGWGTVEFLLDEAGQFHLLELNPRLQVEHAVTEMTSGIDLVRSALRVSCHDRWECVELPEKSEEAIEFRLFARSTGSIEKIGFDGYTWPEHPFSHDPSYRIETATRPGDSVDGVFDGMLARFILSATRSKSRDKLKKWLASFSLQGVEHNLNDLVKSQIFEE